MELWIDDREHAVIKHIKEIQNCYIPYTIKRLTVGDYALVYNNYILVIFERKTWEDLSASMRDGRKNNVHKLINVRKETGCEVVYLIEGTACPKFNKKYNNIPVSALRSHLDHLAFRDHIHIFHSVNQEYTALRLFDVAKNISTIKPSMLKEVDDLIAKTGESPSETESNKLIKKTEEDVEIKSDVPVTGAGDINLLTKKQLNQINTQEQLLRCLPVVGSVTATLLSENGVSLYNIYTGSITSDKIARIKYNTGNAIGITKAKQICDCRKYITNKSQRAKAVQLRILECIPLISKKTALMLIEKITLEKIMNKQVGLETLQQLKRSRINLGAKAGQNLLTYLLNIDAETAKTIITDASVNDELLNTADTPEPTATTPMLTNADFDKIMEFML